MLPRSIYLAFLNHSHSQSSSKVKLPPDSLSSQILSLSQASHTHLPFPMSPHLSSWLWVSVLQYLCCLLILYPLHHISGHLSVSHPQEIVLDLSTSHSSNWALHPCPAPGSRGNSFSFRMNVSASGSYSFCSPVHSGLQVRCRYLGTLVGHAQTFRARSTSSPFPSAPTTLHHDSAAAPALHLAVDADSEDASVAQGFPAQHQPVVKLLARLLPPRRAPAGRQAHQAPGARVQLPATAETPAGPQARSAAAGAPTPAWPRPRPGACPRAPIPTRPRRHRR